MLASSSRNALKRTSTRLERVQCSPVSFAGPLSHRHASTAQASRVRVQPLERTTHNQRRSMPYQFKLDTTFRGGNTGTRLARYNIDLGNKAAAGRLPDMFGICAHMKSEGVRPDITTYHHLLRGCAEAGLHVEARAILEDMQETGIALDRQSLHYILQSMQRLEAPHTWSILDLMKELKMDPDEQTFDILIKRHILSENFEHALQKLMEVDGRQLSPTLESAQSVIILACESGHPRLALDLAEAFDSSSVRRLDNVVWTKLLIASSQVLWADGVQRSWEKVVHEMGISPDEGLCMLVMHTAARHGLPELGNEALEVLGKAQVPWSEHHFAPLVEAFCRAQRLRDAFDVLDIMRTSGVPPLAETASPIFSAISTDLDAVDNAFGVLDELRAAGKNIDVTALNVVVQAAVGLGDLQRAVGTYKAAPGLKVSPNVETFNLLLAGCIGAQHRALGDQLLAEMKAADLTPDARTFERLIVLCLTQENYEDAFFYLEEMKAQKHIPAMSIYEAIVRKCASVGDTRYHIAVQEMGECGYAVSPALEAFIKSNGDVDLPPDAPELTLENVLEEKKKLFLEG